MFKSLRHSSLAVVALAAILSGGCTQQETDLDSTKKEDLALKINVDINFGKKLTRADKNPTNFEPLPATDFEKIATLRVIIFAPDGETMIGNRMVKMDSEMKPINDNLIFPVNSNELLYIYLIANEASLTLPSTITSYQSVSAWLNSFKLKDEYAGLRNVLDNWATGFNSSDVSTSLFQNTDDSHLVMTEMFRLLTDKSKAQIMNSTEDENGNSLSVEYLQTANLFITPSAAKITYRFHFDDYEGSGSNVTGVRLSGINRYEYVFPKNTVYSIPKYKEQNGVINDTEETDRYITSFASPNNNPTGTLSISLTGNQIVPIQKSTEAILRGAYYFPESLSTVGADAFSVQVQLDNGTWLTAQPLKDNILLINSIEAISRSTHLYIDIYFSNQLDLTWVAIEAPYNSVVLKPGFGELFDPEE